MFEVGQELWCVFNQRYHQNTYVVIEKVGKKWLSLSNRYRADIETLTLDGGKYSSPGKCYLSKEEHEAQKELHRRWNAFRNRVGNTYRCPDSVTIVQLEQAFKILEIYDI